MPQLTGWALVAYVLHGLLTGPVIPSVLDHLFTLPCPQSGIVKLEH